MKRKSGKYTYIPILLTFLILFVAFGVTMALVYDIPVSSFSIGSDKAYEGDSGNGYEFLETEGKNGVKYYVITKNSTQSATSEATKQNTGDGDATAPGVSSPANDTTGVTTVTVGTTGTTSTTGTTATEGAKTSESEKTTTTTKTIRSSDEKLAYLTFDDGPSINTEKLLDILDEYDVKATFFVIYHKNMESKYQAIVDRGHTIALHSYTHTYSKIYKTEKGYYEDLNKIHDYVEKLTGVDSKIIRFPGGSSNTVSRKYNKNIMKTLKKSVTEKGYVFHDWNVDSTDASGINRDPDLLVEKVKAGLEKKKPVIDILMHDTGKSKTTTVEALPRIIEAVKAAGYTIEPLTMESEPIQHSW